jgi:hypothetical protein
VSWVRIIQDNGIDHCCRLVPEGQGTAIEISWPTENALCLMLIPPSSFADHEAAHDWLMGLSGPDMERARIHYLAALTEQASSESMARAAIEKAKGLH